jgi:hypothetical protein
MWIKSQSEDSIDWGLLSQALTEAKRRSEPLAQPTSMNVSSVGTGDGTTVNAAVCAGKHSTATAYDGFTIININGANIEGIYRVYGLADS